MSFGPTYDVTLLCENLRSETLDGHPSDGQWLTQILHPVIVLVEEITGQSEVGNLHRMIGSNPVANSMVVIIQTYVPVSMTHAYVGPITIDV